MTPRGTGKQADAIEMKGGFTSHSLRRGMVAVSVAGGIGMMLVAFALAFSNAASAREIAESSQELQWANATAGASAVSRAALNQALVYTVDVELGVATQEAANIARSEARTTLDILSEFLANAPDSSQSDAAEVESVVATGLSALNLMEEGKIREADALLTRDFEPAYGLATAALRDSQESQAARIENAASSAGRTENITRLVVTLLIPAAAIIIHQLIIRRQYREREVHMEAQVEAQKQLNRSKDQFIAGISHELRTPLTTIYGFSEHLLESGFVDPTESLELITMINDDSAELSRMVDDLLAAARIDAEAISYEIDPLELKGEVEHLVAEYGRGAADIAVVGARTVGLADRSRLRQILRNLISNADRHGGNNVEVDVSVYQGQAAIRVIDDGPGVSGEMYNRLFTRFVHEPTDALTSGSVGLGSAIARQMARDMGGDVTYERTLGLTVFTVYLPLAAPDALPVPRSEVPDALYYDSKNVAEVIDIAAAAESRQQPDVDKAVVMFE